MPASVARQWFPNASGGGLTERLADLLTDVDCCLLPLSHDPHPDHQAAARAALSAAPLTAHCWSYPIWRWHWKDRQNPEVPWQRTFRHELTTEDWIRKTSALREFVSQRTNGPDGSEPVLSPDVLEHFERDFEVVFREPRPSSTPMERFNSLYASDEDPWNADASWYERRKRAVVMACLPRNRYHRAAEPGCGTGRLTLDLASRCDRLLAFDGAPLAVAAAREHVHDEPGVTVEQNYLPSGLPEGPLDLVVLSEILYYLSDPDLKALLDSVAAALLPGGDMVAAHWQQWAPEATRDASEAHLRLAQRSELEPRVEHVDEGFSVPRAEALLISAVAVVVPARDEEDAIADCAQGLRRALCRPRSRSQHGVRDRGPLSRPHRRGAPARSPVVRQFVNTHELSLGAVRQAGARAALAELGTPPGRTWVLHTDADSIVPDDWVLTHLRYTSMGTHAVAGLAEIGNRSSHDEQTRQRYAALVNGRIHRGRNKHVYGANLGVRGEAFHHVGGFRPLHSGENRDLWQRLHAADFRLVQPCESPVLTSGRTVSRASGGLADLPRSLGDGSTPRPNKAA